MGKYQIHLLVFDQESERRKRERNEHPSCHKISIGPSSRATARKNVVGEIISFVSRVSDDEVQEVKKWPRGCLIRGGTVHLSLSPKYVYISDSFFYISASDGPRKQHTVVCTGLCPRQEYCRYII